jgi:PAP_fibrillin
LRVDALASTSAYPLAELTQRKSTGKVLGLNILGVSLVGNEAQPDPTRPDSRIDFVFDEGKFDFGSLQLPYPVPFRSALFRDWVKGWIDITWLSDRIRVSRGNKGSTFILIKEEN